jgi:hypothetical protein
VEVTVAALATNAAEVAEAGTVTDAGTLAAALLLESATTAPLPGAAALSVTVQLLVAPEDRVVGLHWSAESEAEGAVSAIEAVLETPLSVAVTTAVWLADIVPATALNVALVLAAGIVTEAGTLSRVLLSDSVTVVPPAGAGPLNVAVHVLAPPEARVAGLHCSDVSETVEGGADVVVKSTSTQ